MSTLTKFRHLYEVLLRFDAEGKLAGAHAQYLSGIAEDGVTLQATPGDAVPLSLVDAADKLTLKKVLGDATAALVEAKEAAESEATEAKARAEADAAEARAELEAKDASIQALLAELEAAKAITVETATPAE